MLTNKEVLLAATIAAVAQRHDLAEDLANVVFDQFSFNGSDIAQTVKGKYGLVRWKGQLTWSDNQVELGVPKVVNHLLGTIFPEGVIDLRPMDGNSPIWTQQQEIAGWICDILVGALASNDAELSLRAFKALRRHWSTAPYYTAPVFDRERDQLLELLKRLEVDI